MSVVERVWYGEDAIAGAARAVLAPMSLAYRAGLSARALMYDVGVLRSVAMRLPVISVGNLTVGGTGKTPVAAWIADKLSAHANPAIVLRGYRGGDEALVHAHLNPAIPVIVDPDRVHGVRTAMTRGADVVVLDDAFQHRRLVRIADVLLVSAEQLAHTPRLIPAGPWREPLAAAARADHIVLTRKSASSEIVELAMRRLMEAAPARPTSVVRLAPVELRTMDGASTSLDALRGADVLAVAAIGEPRLFAEQLTQLGARVTLAAFRDHHAFGDAEIADLARRVPPNGIAVCTLKDAVKLASRWPASSRLWYVSQRMTIEHGADELDRLIQRVLAARAVSKTTAG